MSDTHAGTDTAHDFPHVPYMKVFFTLLIFTVMEYCYAYVMAEHFPLLLTGLLVMAITKAALVGLYFMHLKYEGRWVLFALVPAGVFATILVCALTPDVTFHAVDEDLIPPGGDEAKVTAPAPSPIAARPIAVERVALAAAAPR